MEKLPVQGVAQVARKAETLYANINGLIRRVGIERVGFVTLTTPDNCGDRSEANRRLIAFQRGLLRPDGIESISVPERQQRGAFHFHLAGAFPWDIRTGFDFAACRHAAALKRERQFGGVWEPGTFAEFQRLERQYFQSANERLRSWWRDVRAFNESRRARDSVVVRHCPFYRTRLLSQDTLAPTSRLLLPLGSLMTKDCALFVMRCLSELRAALGAGRTATDASSDAELKSWKSSMASVPLNLNGFTVPNGSGVGVGLLERSAKTTGRRWSFVRKFPSGPTFPQEWDFSGRCVTPFKKTTSSM